MDSANDLEQLRDLARDTSREGHGARLRRALLMLAIPATAAMATACYAVPMNDAYYAETVTVGPTVYLDGMDCDGDGLPESISSDRCDETTLSLALPEAYGE